MRYIFSSARLEARIEFESSRALTRFDSIFHRTEQRSCRLDSINVRVRFDFRNFEQNTLLDSIDLESNSSCSNQLDSRSQLCLHVILFNKKLYVRNVFPAPAVKELAEISWITYEFPDSIVNSTQRHWTSFYKHRSVRTMCRSFQPVRWTQFHVYYWNQREKSIPIFYPAFLHVIKKRNW